MKQKLIFIIPAILVCLLIGGVFLVKKVNAVQARESLKLGNKYLQEGKYEEAILAFQKVIKIEPKNVEARLGLGKAYIATNQFDKAEKVLKEALEIEEKNMDAILQLSDLYIKEGKVDKAQQFLKEAFSKTGYESLKKTLEGLKAESPKVSLLSGTYTQLEMVTITPSAAGQVIYYTLDGQPVSTNSPRYTETLQLPPGETTLKVAAVNEAGVLSQEETYHYNIQLEEDTTAVTPGTTEKPEDQAPEEDYIISFSNSRLITIEDIKDFTPEVINYARNEIYARRGYQFRQKEFLDFFSQKSWYKPDPNFSDKNFTEIEVANIEFLLQYSTTAPQQVGKKGSKEALIDLNYDGKKDKIVLVCEEYGQEFILKINDSSVRGEGDGLEGVFYIYDIDNSDKFKEIAITEVGPSDDYATAFYAYDGKNIIFVGKIAGSDYSIKVDGSGTLITEERGRVLHTWFYDAYYKLDGNHVLYNVPQELYTMNTKVTLMKEITLQKSRTDKSVSAVLKVGEKAVITVTDNVKWCKLETASGKSGWFSVEGIYGGEFFEGLSYAD